MKIVEVSYLRRIKVSCSEHRSIAELLFVVELLRILDDNVAARVSVSCGSGSR